jgi:hypothetical protein
MMKYLYTIFFLIFVSNVFGYEDRDNQELYQVQISRATDEIRVDGVLDEASWKNAKMASDFWMSFPNDTDRADPKTEVRLTYNDDFLYVSAVCYDDKNYVIQSLKRDVDFWSGDGFAFVIDPINQRTNGFLFGVSPLGVQMESLLSGSVGARGSRPRGVNDSWDNKWFAEVEHYEDRWTVEIAIPFKSLRYEQDKTTWGINFLRSHMETNEYHCWAKVPVRFRGIDLGYTGALNWDVAPKRTKGNIAIIPYVTGSASKDYAADLAEDRKLIPKTNAGLDAKFAISSSLNLDLTVNPDFSQIEVDQQVTNLSRFSIRFPERRTFFLENSDIFSDFGTGSARPFFSRRIGLDEDNNQVPIVYGLRLSGNLDNKSRVGLMNIHTRGDSTTLGQNYTAAAFHRRVFARSVLKGYVLNRQAFDDTDAQKGDFGRNAGLEYTYQSSNGNTRIWGGYNHSFKEGYSDDNYMLKTGFNFSNTNWSAWLSYNYLGNNYFADMGFLQNVEDVYDANRDTTFRQGYHSLFTNLAYTHFAKSSSKLNRHRFSAFNSSRATPTGHHYSRFTQVDYEMMFKNRSNLKFKVSNNYIELFSDFFYTSTDSLPIANYTYNIGEIEYRSDSRKTFGFEGRLLYGSFYNGTRSSIRLGVNYRTRPWGNFGLQMEYNKLEFPAPFADAELLLISPRIEINFSKNIFWTTFLQYNTQADNFNINSRLQWRFKPMSDIFLVYTDNYAVEVFGQKNRGIIFKMNYWLNL